MKKLYFTKEARLKAKRDRNKHNRDYTASMEKYIERIPESGCWLWVGCVDRGGYGYTRMKGIQTRAHRYIYEMYKGAIGEGKSILHKCDVRCCVNPDHLYEGSQLDNMRDRHNKRYFK